MAEKKEIELVLFGRDGLEDFRDFILDNVYDDLFLLDDFSDSEVFGIGALADGEPAGAAVISLFGNNIAYLNSIAAADDLRRQGIGTSLLDGAVKAAYDRMGGFAADEAERVNISLLTDYFTGDGDDAFESFIRAYGFEKEDEEDETVWVIPWDAIEASSLLSPALAPDFRPAEGIVCLAEAAGEYADDLAEFAELSGSYAEIDYTFLAGSADAPRGMVIFAGGRDDSFAVTSRRTESCTDEDFINMLRACIGAAAKNTRGFELSLSSLTNDLPDSWESLDLGGAVRFSHKRAHLYLTVE